MRKWILSGLLFFFVFSDLSAQQTTISNLPRGFVCVGGTIIIACNYGNIGTSYNWEVSADHGNTWSPVTNSSVYSLSLNNAGSWLTIAPLDTLLNTTVYRCTVFFGDQHTPSIGDTLYVASVPPAAPQFVDPPTSVCGGATIPITVTGGFAYDSVYWHITSGDYSSHDGLGDSTNIIHFVSGPGTMTLSVEALNACPGGGTTSLPITINATQSTLAGTAGGSTDCSSYSVLPGDATTYSDGTCSPIAVVTPSGASPVSGAIQSCVTVDASVQTFNGVPYVPRYYSLEPATNAATSTATVTLYFTQADFDAYNAARGSNPALPTGPTDVAGVANLTISQFHGTGTTPDTYVGTAGTIVPGAGNVVWNATDSRWEVTFDVTGFSGFFASGGSIIPLPMTLTAFSGKAVTTGDVLSWTTADEENTAWFEVERAVAGQSNFQLIGKVAAAGNSAQPLQYSYTDELTGLSRPVYSYRLRMVDLDGKFTYSPIVTVQSSIAGLTVRLSPNPFVQPVSLNIGSPTAGAAVLTVTDMDGRKLVVRNIILQRGDNSLDPAIVASLSRGVYFMSVTGATQQQTIKIVKE